MRGSIELHFDLKCPPFLQVTLTCGGAAAVFTAGQPDCDTLADAVRMLHGALCCVAGKPAADAIIADLETRVAAKLRESRERTQS